MSGKWTVGYEAWGTFSESPGNTTDYEDAKRKRPKEGRPGWQYLSVTEHATREEADAYKRKKCEEYREAGTGNSNQEDSWVIRGPGETRARRKG